MRVLRPDWRLPWTTKPTSRIGSRPRSGIGPAPAADDPAFVEHLATVFGDSLVGDRQLAVFGFVCSCAVSQLDAFEAHLGRGAVRAVEVHGNAARMPIWPHDPVRDAIIESGGTYGR